MKKAGTGEEGFKFEGRTIRELESYLSGRQANSLGIIKVLLIFLAIAVLLVLPGSLIWTMKQDVASLKSENARLSRENSSLQQKLAGVKSNIAPTVVAGASPQTGLQPSGQTGAGAGSSVAKNISQGEPDGLIHHQVQPGEYLSLISQQYYGTIKYTGYLAGLNGIDMNSRLNVGQVIKLPKEPDKSWAD
jgi:LysM repeat protein